MTHTWQAMARAIPVVDLAFLALDRTDAPANVGIVMVFEPAAGTTPRKAVSEVLRAYRAAKPTHPFDVVPEIAPVGLPHWVTASGVDMSAHVMHETLDAPGSLAQLHERIAELHRARLDRTRPLFEVHLFDGLEGGRFALYIKSHHVTWDGRSAAARIFGSLSRRPGALRKGFHATSPAGTADAADAGGGGLAALLTHAAALRELYTQVTGRIAALRAESGGRRGNTPFAGPHTRLNQRVVAERSFATFSLPLEEMRNVGHRHVGSINDVLLAVVDAGVHRYLRRMGEPPGGPLVAMCPVSTREPGDVEFATKASTMFVTLGGPRGSVARRLDEVVTNTARAKQEFRLLSKEASLDFALLAFGLWVASDALGLGAYTRPVVNYVVSNVGGVDGPHYLGRSRLVGAYPVSMVADPAGLNFTSFSHDGRMDVGIVASRAAVPDAQVLADDCLAAWTQLRRKPRTKRPENQDLSLRKPPARRPSRTRRMPASQRP
jgi:diacylglycerol O-acyltransferase